MRLSGYELSAHFEEDVLVIRKYAASKNIFTVVYYDGEQKYHYIKRFQPEASEKPARFVEEHPEDQDSYLFRKMNFPRLEIKFGGKHKKREPEIIDAEDFIAIKSIKAKGKRLSNYEVASVTELEPVRFKGSH